MSVHDWVRVAPGTFHDFHSAWITHLKEALNDGVLPEGYYAMAEQHAGRLIADVLTLETAGHGADAPHDGGTVAVAPPRVSRKMVASPNAAYRAARRTLAVRHVSGHRIIALVEILSPANKDRASSISEFVDKVHSALHHGCHVLVIDLFRPGPYDPHGVHGAVWEAFDPEDYVPPADKPLMLASYAAAALPEAYLTPVAVGDALPAMPLFLRPDWHIDTPLEPTYAAAYRGLPAYWRGVLEGREGSN